MVRRSQLAFASVLAVTGCASAAAEPGPAAPPGSPEPTCVPVDTSAEASISVLEGDDVRVHSFVAPEVASGTATHVIETADALVVVDTHMLRHYAEQFRRDQLVIRVPAAKVLILQDLMATDTHGFISAGFEEHWVEVLEQYRAAEGYEHVLAGHGSPTDIAGIATMIDYVERSAAIVSKAKSRSEFRDAMKAAFPDKSGLYLVDLMGKLLFPR